MSRWSENDHPKLEAKYEHGRQDMTIELNPQETEEVAAVCAKAMIRQLSAPLVTPKEEPEKEM